METKPIFAMYVGSRNQFMVCGKLLGFVATHWDLCVYKSTTQPLIMLAIFIDDMLITNSLTLTLPK
jgi:hypothetical protein